MSNKTLPPDWEKFIEWYKIAKPGDVYVYHTGFIGLDIATKQTVHIKHIAWNYAINGRVYLVQKRRAEGEYDYLAQKARISRRQLIPRDYLSETYIRYRQPKEKTSG